MSRAPSIFAVIGMVAAAVAPARADIVATGGGTVANWGSTEQYFSQRFGLAAGLPQIDTLCALQTRDGYLWVGTGGGLVRFDGTRFVAFRGADTPALADPLIHCLYEDRAGDLWIGTEGGAIRYRAGVFERVGPANLNVFAIVQDQAGRVWLGTDGNGLYEWRDGALQPAGGSAMAHRRISYLLADTAGRLWVGRYATDGLVCLVDGVATAQVTDAISDEVDTIAEYPRGTVWFGSRHHGLFRLQGSQLSHFDTEDGLAGSQIADLRPARDGGLWVATSGALQRIVDPVRFRLRTVAGIPIDSGIAGFCEDREGDLWLCTYTGLIQARQTPFRLISSEDGPPAKVVKTVTEDPAGNVWLATRYAAVTKIAPSGAATTYASTEVPPEQEPVLAYAARDGGIWVEFGYGNLRVLRDGQWRAEPDFGSVHSIYQDHTGALWMGNGMHQVLRFADGRYQKVDLGGVRLLSYVASIAEGPDGAMYLGSWSDGLIELKGGRARLFNHANGLPSDRVRAIYVDPDNHLWVGLRLGGLALRLGDRWWHSTAAGASVMAITEDHHGRLWLGTPGGVMWVDKGELLAAARGGGRRPDIHLAGPPVVPVWSGSQPIVWRSADGRLLFATAGGLFAVDPDRVAINPVGPPVHIESVAIDGQAAPFAAGLTVPAGTRQLAIRYTAISFVEPERMLFKYKLDGYDSDWVDAGAGRVALYTYLPAGRYVFRVKADNSDGVWNEAGAQLGVAWAPHFYETGWCYTLAIAALGALTLGLHWRHTAALRRDNQRLERGVAERTRELELANAVITERTKELELASTAKSEFLEIVGHEINNPLNGLNGLLGLLQRRSLDPEARSLTKSLQACAQILTRIFEQVLSFTKLEYGSVALRPAPFALRALLHEVAESFAWQAGQRGNRIAVEIAPGAPDRFEGDAGKIETIVGNFVGNALKYAPGSPVEIRAEIFPGDDGRHEVHVEVRDWGPGIPAEEQELIFKKFVRGSAARQHDVAGTGLGLASCRFLARALGGNVGVESESGRGATFYLRVPLRGAEEAAAVEAGGAALIVEDEHYNQIVLREIVRELGYEAEVAGTAEEASALLGGRRYRTIFLDWQLPGLKGDEVARRVRAQVEGDKPVIIATTAYDSDEIRRRCREAGMDDFLRKPYDLEQVRRCIGEVLARRSGKPAGLLSAAASPEKIETTPGSGPSLNLNALRLYARASTGRLATAAQRYAGALDDELARLRRSVESGDWPQSAVSAHRLNAIGGLLGARELSGAAGEFESLSARSAPADRQRAFESTAAAVRSLQRQIGEVTRGSGEPA